MILEQYLRTFRFRVLLFCCGGNGAEIFAVNGVNRSKKSWLGAVILCNSLLILCKCF